jgi:7,8-dihydropterin-6-yl-methyl-4-(beta-D-ribofuranosyl)aminobenzene 5'-phosphate synthase
LHHDDINDIELDCNRSATVTRNASQDRKIEVVRIVNEAAPSVEKLRITLLVEDSVSMEKPDLIAKHGLSFLLGASVAGTISRILVDAGPPPDIALQNADVINTDMREVDVIVISHGHYDHAGGLLKILERVGRPVPIVTHPRVFSPKFVCKPSLRFIGLEFNQPSIESAKGVLLLARNSVKILDGVVTSGEIARETTFEKAVGFWTVEDERFIEDQIIDDQALFVNVKDKGLVVITGCAHSGIVNTVKHAQKITGINNVYAIVGGFHLAKSNDRRIQASIDELSRVNPKSIHPCHCTGFKAIHRLAEVFKDRCKPIQTGDTIEL